MARREWKVTTKLSPIAGITIGLMSLIGAVHAITVNETCLGSEELNWMEYPDYKARYSNCKYVVGNILLEHWWYEPELHANNFLENIEVVTGSVNIFASSSTAFNVVFPKLKIIRGESLAANGGDGPKYALLVTSSGKANFTVQFPELKEISNGAVGIFTTHRQCSLEKLNWEDITEGSDPQFYYFPQYDRETNFHVAPNLTESGSECKCHSSCGGSGCWGEGENECQKLSKVHCSPYCEGRRCFDSGPQDCCHYFCSGGCSGPTRSDCVACTNVKYDGKCRSYCPSGMYSFGENCVKSCPEDSLIDESSKSCLFECPPHKLANKGKCVKIRQHIKKCSKLASDVHTDIIEHFRNCTVYEGNIIIECEECNLRHNSTHSKGVKSLREQDLEIFRTLRKVTGLIQFRNVNFSSISYFENLEEVGGDLIIFYTGIKRIEFPVLRTVVGRIEISNNPNLCYVNTLNLSTITTFTKPKRFAVQIYKNGDPEKCARDGQVCSEQCSNNGCWGEGPENCLCLEYRQEGRCVSDCDKTRGFFISGHLCVNTCPPGKYEASGECLDCHENCRDGCTGPESYVGRNGCDSCYQAVYNESSIICMGDGEDCPPNLFLHLADGEYLAATDYICAEPTSGGQILFSIFLGALLIILTLAVGFMCYRKNRNRTASTIPTRTTGDDQVNIIQELPYSALANSEL